MPAHLACSGASDSGVMPGWVLSSRMTSPDVPGLESSQRRSARLRPLQPSAWWAIRLTCVHAAAVRGLVMIL